MKEIITYGSLIVRLIFSSITGIPVTEIITIENITNPQQVIWKDYDNIIIVDDNNISQYTIHSKSLELIQEKENNEFVGLDNNGDILLCKIEHYNISSYDDFSTKFTVLDKEYSFFETIKPVFIDEEKIIAVTALDFLEQHYYEITLENGQKEEIDKPEEKEYSLTIPENIDSKKTYIKDENNYVIEDIFGNLYIYRNLDITNTIIPMLTPILNAILTKTPIADPTPAFKLLFKSL